jgi:hypothetical protein
MRRVLSAVCFLLWASTAQAQYTYQTLDVQAQGRLIALRAILEAGEMAGATMGLSGRAWRLDAALTPSEVVCPPSDFVRDPTDIRAGMSVAGMSASQSVVGTDIRASDHRSVGLIATAAGPCQVYVYPGSLGNTYTAIAPDATLFAGLYWTDAEPGLLGQHGFLQTPTGALAIDGPGLSDRNVITGVNSAGVSVGCGYRAIGADQSYQPQGWLRTTAGAFVDLTLPDGQPFAPMAINDAGQVVGHAGECGVITGGSAVYDSVMATWTLLNLPTPDTLTVVATGISATGTLVGEYTERVATGLPAPKDFTLVTHQFRATRSSPEEPRPPIKRQRWHHPKRQHLPHLREVQHAHGRGLCLDENKRVVYWDGERVYGD